MLNGKRGITSCKIEGDKKLKGVFKFKVFFIERTE